MQASCSLQSELRQRLGIRLLSRGSCPLSLPLYYVCSPGHIGHDDLTSSPPSSVLSTAVTTECPTLLAGNCYQGLRSLRDLTQHLTTRADDNHAPPVVAFDRIGTSTPLPK